MIVNITYVDVDYWEELEEDSVTIGLKDEDLNQFLNDFYNFSSNYMNGYEYGDILDGEDAEEILKEEYPDITLEEAEYFADLRNNGLTGNLVVSAFIEKYPQYDCEFNGRIITDIEFNEYSMYVNGEKYLPLSYSTNKEEDIER